MTPEDDAMLRALGGATFRGNVTLPSGQIIGPDEVTALSSVYADERRHDPDDFRRQRFLDNCRPATAADYQAWLDGYRARGGATTHDYDYPFPSGWFVLERSDVTMPPLCGSRAVHVIVPEGMRLVVQGDLYARPGHNSAYLMDGFRTVYGGFPWVPTYRDVL